MGLEKKFGFLNGCIFIREAGICAASDLHIGLEDELCRQGLAFPLQEERMLRERMELVLEKFRPSLFVLAGDVLHSFDRIDGNVRRKFAAILKTLEKQCPVILLQGSHDTMVSSLGRFLDRYDAAGYTFAHGHAALGEHGNLVLGHEHPVIQIEMERMPCFLFGEKLVNGKDIVILPAFNPLCQGVTINRVERRDLMSPLLKRVDVDGFCPVLEVQGEVLAFPKLGELRRHIG
jgi:putative SbcD/Mre11-related phosphoesterase